jgi:hypothetical protein
MDDDTDLDDDVTSGGPKTKRSPRFPGIGFMSALDKARSIFNADGLQPTRPEIAARHTGLQWSGQAKVMIASLKQYGLLESVGTDVRVSKNAERAILLPADDPDRAQLLAKMALQPPLFQTILSKFPEKLPSDATLISKLRLEYGFVSEDAAKRFVASLREAVRIADGAPTPTSAAGNATVGPPPPPVGGGALEQPMQANVQGPQPARRPDERPASIDFGEVGAKVSFWGTFTQQQFEIMKLWLESKVETEKPS